MKKLMFLLFFFILIVSGLYSQKKYQREELFLDANSWFFYEDYEEALPIFLRLLQSDSLNYNIMYKIGFCYLHIPGQSAKSISHLEKAVTKTTAFYRNNKYAENYAPVDALFYLGNAYLVNNRIDDAIDAYTKFQNTIEQINKFPNKTSYDDEYINKQFDACGNAIQFQNKPVSFLARNIGSKINTKFNEYNAVVSGDGSTLVFTASLQFYDAIFYSKKENGQWSYPANIMGQLGLDDKSATTGLSFDGTEMYIYRDDDFDGNIYVSYLRNGIWTNVKKLGENINTKYWEAHASLSPDNKELYFVSNREGGFGDLDIYVAKRLTDSTWGIPKNLSNKINTRWNENTPYLTPDGKKLFFSSEGHEGMGGYDIFYSNLNNGKWTEPVNMGYPINTTDNDLFFVPVEKGNYAYCSQFSKKGYGGLDIYQFQIFDLPGFSNFHVEGLAKLDNNINKNRVDFKINIINKLNKDTLNVLSPEQDLKQYKLLTPLGKNHLVYESTLNEKGEQYYISTPYNISEVFLKIIDTTKVQSLAFNDSIMYETVTDRNNVEIEAANTSFLNDTSAKLMTDKAVKIDEKGKDNVEIKLAMRKGSVNSSDELISSSKSNNHTTEIMYLLENYLLHTEVIPYHELITKLKRILNLDTLAISGMEVLDESKPDLIRLKKYLANQNIYSEEELNHIIKLLEDILLVNSTDDLLVEVVERENFAEYFKILASVVISFIILSLLIVFLRCRKNNNN